MTTKNKGAFAAAAAAAVMLIASCESINNADNPTNSAESGDRTGAATMPLTDSAGAANPYTATPDSVDLRDTSKVGGDLSP